MLTRTATLAALALALAACGPADQDPSAADPAGSCTPSLPLDDEIVSSLRMSSFHYNIQMKPGDERELKLFNGRGTTIVNACQLWTVHPENAGASIRDDNVLVIAPTAEPGTVFTLVAHTDGGSGPELSTEVYVYSAATHPLVGRYTESSQNACGAADRDPEMPVGELEFRADGTFYVTWLPFNQYIDYSGDYIYDVHTGMLQMSHPEGNYVPEDFDGSGSAQMVPGQGLVLNNIWLGSYGNTDVPAGCGHTFN